MLRRLRTHLTYANVVSSIALFAAIGGGTAYAATKLSRNSVGASQIRTKAVGNSELRSNAVTTGKIRNGTIRTTDLAIRTRDELRGAQGPVGPPGVAGAGQPTYRVLSVRGGYVAGNAEGINHEAGANTYEVGFKTDVSACSFSATLTGVVAGGGIQEPTAGSITVQPVLANPRTAVVKAYNASGQPTEQPFHLLVFC